MLTDLIQIRRLGEKGRADNERFRKHLKRHNFAEPRLGKIAQDIEDQIDCLACANCCRVASTQITERDVERMARFLRIKPAQFLKDYAVESEEEGLILRRTETGCVFLDGNACSIYEARPNTCENFPHLVKGNGSLLSRMWHMPDRACYCPIVYNTIEAFKKDVGYSSFSH